MNSDPQGQAPFSTLYEVYETCPDLSQEKLVYQSFVRDIAETRMYFMFRASGYGKDFVLFNRKTKDIEVACFTAETKRLRGECQG